MKMLPPKPFCEDPDPTYTEPLPPTLAVPVLKASAPLAPDTPAFEVVSVTDPLELSLLNPLWMFTDPPKAEEPALPAEIDTLPPLPLSPDPTDMRMEPPRPERERPVPKYTDPLSPFRSLTPEPTNTEPLGPLLAVPVLKTTEPLTPRLPAFELWSSNEPLLEDDP